MACRAVFACVFVLVALGITGCATPVREPPPEVAPQPPDVTAQQAITEGEAAVALAETAAAAPAPAPARSRTERFRPTSLSTREIRERNASAPRALDFQQRLDYAHDRVYTWGQSVVEATDRGLAADDKPLRPVPAAPFRLGSTLELIDRGASTDPSVDVKFDIALSLPNIERRLRIFITSDALDSDTRDVSRHSTVRAGLRYELLNNVDFDVGVRVDLPPVAFSAVKWSREFPLGSWEFYPLVKLFAETRESVGWATGATFDRWSGRQLLRSSTYAKWRHDRDQTEWAQTLVFARARELMVPDRYGSYISADDIGRGWGLRALVSGGDTRHVARYEASLFYRNRTPSRWLYWFIEPLVRWDRAYGFNADPGVRIGIDALFWDLAR